jgi:hypothetical protein
VPWQMIFILDHCDNVSTVSIVGFGNFTTCPNL